MKRWFVSACVAALLAGGALPAMAQSRPLITEDPETVPAGNILVEAGLDFLQDALYPASGLTGNVWKVATFGLSFGVSSMAEIQIDGGLRNRMAIKSFDLSAPLAHMLSVTGTSTSDVEDIVIGTKLRFAGETERRPAMAIRFWTRLPNAGNESGLGTDTTDFNFGFAIAKTVQSVRIAGNAGLGILADPVRGDRQNDVFTYGASVARAVATGVELVGELNGRWSTRSGVPPVSTESRALMRVGARVTRSSVRADGALIVGVTERDPVWGFTAGLTWVFKAFTVK